MTVKGVFFFKAVILLLALPAVPVQGAEEFSVKRADHKERYDRDVDEAALASQEKAIAKLKTLLRKYKNTRQDPILRMRLAEAQQQSGAILFRIAHGHNHGGKAALGLARFHKAVHETIETLNQLIAAYPRYQEIPHAYFIRGKSYEEIQNKPIATKDYLHLVQQFPDSEDAPSAYMSLAEFSIEANDHSQALSYLSNIEKLPENSFYPFAIFKMAWAHYNLKNIPSAMRYVEKHVAFYNTKGLIDPSGGMVASDSALKENMLLDSALFYLAGYEEKLSQYGINQALKSFKSLESGPTLGKMIHRFAKLLRSHGHELDLIEWKNQIMDSESSRPETLDVLITVFENQVNHRRYDQMVATAKDMVRLHQSQPTFEGFSRAEKLLLETANQLQEVIVKNKGATEIHTLSSTLASVYDSFIQIVKPEDTRIPGVHYNLAETLFAIHDYSGATEHYRWIVEHGKRDLSVSDASLKAIASRYEVLRAEKLIPTEIRAKSFQSDSKSPIPVKVAEWIQWIDALYVLRKEGLENFYFEANRALYNQNHILEAYDRLHRFALKNPKNPYAVPSASLAIDTQIAGAAWKETHRLAHQYLRITEWGDASFLDRLFSIVANASYQLMDEKFRSKDFAGVLLLAPDFISQYKKSDRFPDAIFLAGNAAVAIDHVEQSKKYYSMLIQEAPKSHNLGHALLSRAKIHEDQFQFAEAAVDYELFLKLEPNQRKSETIPLNQVQSRLFTLTWLTADFQKLETLLSEKKYCGEKNIEECEKYGILSKFLSGAGHGRSGETDAKAAFDQSRKTSGERKTLWALLALRKPQDLSFYHRLLAMRSVAAGWDELDSLLKFSLIPVISSWIPRAFEMDRKEMKDFAPLRPTEKSIAQRVDAIKEMEVTATKLMKMPWSRIRARVLNDMAHLYIELSKGIASFSSPEDSLKKLVLPFEEKGQEMRLKAFEIASRASIEEEDFNSISRSFFEENPSQAKALKGNLPMSSASAPAIDLQLASQLGSTGTGKTSPWSRAWSQAIEMNRPALAAYLLQEAQKKNAFTSGQLGVFRAISLVSAGAQGEGLMELDDARKNLDSGARFTAWATLIQYSMKTFARAKVQDYLKEIPVVGTASQPALSPEQVSLIALATSYVEGDRKSRQLDRKTSSQ